MDGMGNENLNFDVFNTLNLLDPELGESYKAEGYNPLGEDYRMNRDFLIRLLDLINDEEQVNTEDFLEQNNRTAVVNYELALKSAEEIRSAVVSKRDMTSINDPQRLALGEAVFYLDCRIKLLTLDIGKLKNENVNPFELYLKLSRINPRLAKTLKDTFKENPDIALITENFISECLLQRSEKKTIEKAKEANVSEKKQAMAEESDLLKQKEIQKQAAIIKDRERKEAADKLLKQKETSIVRDSVMTEYKEISLDQ